MAYTRLSTRGQVVLPRDVRNRHGWRQGTVLEVVEQGDGVVLRAARRRRTTLEDVIGCLRYTGRPVSLEEMDAAVRELARERGR